ncbi:MAG TPA: UDP-N-acetylmuramoyl-L-alanine--D-glutamate ligase, partial [Candidatus Kapabacteria bacterium]|nr:UDP-N-acetylmuramoyl-L-alanine--D-glutamate ligase [Candidatus Kapabacteria bacterium]
GITIVNETNLPPGVDFAVHSSQVGRQHPIVQKLIAANVTVLSDLELSARNLFCLSVAITGTNGKTTTAELVASMLEGAQRKTVRAGASGEPVCSIGAASRELDFATLDLNSFQVESIEHYRPSVAVVTNLKGDHLDRYSTTADYVRAIGRVFKNQQVFDWAIVQTEALAHLRSLGVEIPSKLITFSARNRRADIFLDRGLLVSSLPNWSGPLFNMEQCALAGPHNAENIMAAMAVGRVLRVPLEQMILALKAYRPGPHRLETVAEINAVRFINNSKAMNVDAVQQSIEALPVGTGGEPNIWLIAGGQDKGLDYHDLGPLLTQRVKGAFLMGESREKLRASWSLFTPCTAVNSLLEAVQSAAENAVAGDIVLLSPACSSFDMFENYQDRGRMFRAAVEQLTKAADLSVRAEKEPCPI